MVSGTSLTTVQPRTDDIRSPTACGRMQKSGRGCSETRFVERWVSMSFSQQPWASAADALVGIYDAALPQVYGYLLSRCRSTSVAEDLTSETMMTAVVAIKQERVAEVSVAWLVGVARHKLADHWRRQDREHRRLSAVALNQSDEDDPWDAVIDARRAHDVLDRLPPMQRLALALRYLDGLPVAEVADHVGRSLRATETLLVRARRAFRHAYTEGDDDHGE